MNDLATPNPQPGLDERIEVLLDAADRMFIATAMDGNASGASVFFARDGEDLVFFTFNPSRKAEQIRLNPEVQLVVWPRDAAGIRGLQISGECMLIRDPAAIARAREAILQVTDAFRQFMDDPFLLDNGVVGYYRVRPTVIKYVDFHADNQFEWREYPHNRTPVWRALLRATGARTRLWLRASRAPFFTATLVPVLLGAAIAWGELRGAGSAWDWTRFWLIVLGALCAHAGTNLANDFGDHLSRNDEWNRVPSPFNGGSRVIQAGLLAPWKIALAAGLCFGATILVGLRLNASIGGWVLAPTPLLFAGLLGIGLGAMYTLGPWRLSYEGVGELAIALGFGPVMVLGSHYVLSAGAPWQWQAPLLASLPVAVMVTLIIWINEFPDVPADRRAGKRTWVVRTACAADGTVSYRLPLRIYAALFALAAGLVLMLGLLGLAKPALASPFALLALPAFVLAVSAVRRARQWSARWDAADADRRRLPYELLSVNATTIGLHLLVGLLLIAGYAISAYLVS